MTYMNKIVHPQIEEHDENDDALPGWALPVAGILAGAGLLLLGTVAGHVWTLAACIDPGFFGVAS